MITDLRRRRTAGVNPNINLKTRALSADKALRLVLEWQKAAAEALQWLSEHSQAFGLVLQIPPNPFQLKDSFDLSLQTILEDRFLRVGSGPDELVWFWGWPREFQEAVWGQAKRRKFGIFIPARRTRSPRSAKLYIRIPHK